MSYFLLGYEIFPFFLVFPKIGKCLWALVMIFLLNIFNILYLYIYIYIILYIVCTIWIWFSTFLCFFIKIKKFKKIIFQKNIKKYKYIYLGKIGKIGKNSQPRGKSMLFLGKIRENQGKTVNQASFVWLLIYI